MPKKKWFIIVTIVVLPFQQLLKKLLLKSATILPMKTDVSIPDGFEQAAAVLGVLPSAESKDQEISSKKYTPEERISASDQVRQFMALNHIVPKTVVIPPSEAWIGGAMVQTETPLLGITYIYEETV